MGNCANKPLTAEGEVPAPEEKATTTVEEREIKVDQNKVILVADDAVHFTTNCKPQLSLAQLLDYFEDEGKKPEIEEATKPTVEKPTEPAKIEEVVAKVVAVETKKEEAPKPSAEPPKPEASEPKKEEIKPVVAPTVVAPTAAPAVVAPTTAPSVVAPATVEKKEDEKKPAAK